MMWKNRKKVASHLDQGGRTQKKWTLQKRWSWTSGLQNHETVYFYCFTHPVCGTSSGNSSEPVLWACQLTHEIGTAWSSMLTNVLRVNLDLQGRELPWSGDAYHGWGRKRRQWQPALQISNMPASIYMSKNFKILFQIIQWTERIWKPAS